MSAHIHTYTYIHTRIQNAHMNKRKARLKRRRGSVCADSPTCQQEALPFSLSASRQRAVQTTSAYLHWCGADPPSSLSTPARSLAMPAHGPPKRGHFSAILAGYIVLSRHLHRLTDRLLKVAYRVLQYFKTTRNFEITSTTLMSDYENTYRNHFYNAPDASFALCPITKRSHQGGSMFMNTALIQYNSSLQQIVA